MENSEQNMKNALGQIVNILAEHKSRNSDRKICEFGILNTLFRIFGFVLFNLYLKNNEISDETPHMTVTVQRNHFKFIENLND